MKGYLYVIIGACSYGILSTFVKIAYGKGFIVNDVVGIQLFLGALLLWASVLIQKKIRQRSSTHRVTYTPISKKEIFLLLTVGSSTGLTGMLYYLSLQYISASLAIVLLFQFTWIGLIIESLITRRFPGKIKLISLLPLLIGTLFAANLGNGQLDIHPLGFVFGILAAISYSVFIYSTGQIAAKSNPIVKTALMITGGFIICAIILPPNFLINFKLFLDVSLSAGIYLAFFGPFLSTLMFSKGTPMIGTGMASLLGAMELPTAIIMSQIVLKEVVTWQQYLGMAMIILAISLPQLITTKQQKKATSLTTKMEEL